MSSNIEIQRICEYCNKEFTAQTTTTRYCSHKCNSRHYKAKVKQVKIDNSNKETLKKTLFPLEQLKAKEFLTVKDVATLLNCSTKTVYRQIENGNIDAINLGERLTRIKRSTINKLFNNQIT